MLYQSVVNKPGRNCAMGLIAKCIRGDLMIKVSDLVKEFPKKDGDPFRAVDGVSFEARDGEIVCLLGVNGAGKTTTMRVLSTVFKPTRGTAEIQGF
jgi:ABC-type Na+ transport system ATPase subunit NatA